MPDLIDITRSPVRASGSAVQPLYLATDVSSYSCLDVLLYVPSIEGNNRGITLSLRTGLHMDSDDGWVALCNLPTLSAVSFRARVRVHGHMSYVRWSLAPFTWATAVTFWIQALGYRSYPGAAQ
jgi:hypothetical protein